MNTKFTDKTMVSIQASFVGITYTSASAINVPFLKYTKRKLYNLFWKTYEPNSHQIKLKLNYFIMKKKLASSGNHKLTKHNTGVALGFLELWIFKLHHVPVSVLRTQIS